MSAKSTIQGVVQCPREADMLLRCLVFLIYLISAQLSLSQEGKANPRVPVKLPNSKAIVYVVGDVHSPVGVRMGDIEPTTVLPATSRGECRVE